MQVQVQVQAMLASCDRGTAAGRRDLAILTLLARMGLRAGEVAGLRLDDIDWRLGEITVRGKGNRRDRLPLPADAGEAVAGWPSQALELRQRPLSAALPLDGNEKVDGNSVACLIRCRLEPSIIWAAALRVRG